MFTKNNAFFAINMHFYRFMRANTNIVQRNQLSRIDCVLGTVVLGTVVLGTACWDCVLGLRVGTACW